MHLASMGGSSDIVKLLIDKGANTNAKNVNRKTPLHCAAEYGFVDVVTVLVQRQKGSEHINCWDECKRTPLHLAAKNNHVAVIKCLQKYVYPESNHFSMFLHTLTFPNHLHLHTATCSGKHWTQTFLIYMLKINLAILQLYLLRRIIAGKHFSFS